MNLAENNIQSLLEHADEAMKLYGIDHARRIRYAFLIEEFLLIYREKDPGADFQLKFQKYRRRLRVILYVRSAPYNVLLSRESVISNHILSELDPLPTWKYQRGLNVITLMPALFLPKLRNVHFLTQYFSEKRKYFSGALFLRLLHMGLAVLDPILAAVIIVAYSTSEYRRIGLLAMLILVQTGLSSLLTYAYTRMLRKFYSSVVKKMRTEVAENVLQIKTEHIINKGSGVFTNRMLDETANVIDGIDDLLIGSTNLLNLISLLIAFLLVSPKMLVFILITLTIYGVIQNAQARTFNRDSRYCCASNERNFSFSGEMVRGHRDIRLLHCEDSFLRMQKNIVEESADLITQKRIHSMNFELARSQLISVSNFLYMALLAFMMLEEGMAPSVALVLFNYNAKVFSSVAALSNLAETFDSLSLSSELIYQLYSSHDFAKETFGSKHLDHVRGEIELRNINYSYRDESGHRQPTLKGLNMHIRAGESVAIVGRSGCGKSTILSLISRLFDPDQGIIMLDGNDVQELDRDTLRGNIATVSQTPYIFNMSIRDNMRIIKHDLTDEEIEKACRLACIHDDIMTFPDGYDTVIGEGGVTLSGGQKQRLAIARCLVRDYSVIMLDEATSALDNVTQAQVLDAIRAVHGNKTLIMVAHRLSTVINCEKLFFIYNGKVLAEGSHRELLETCEEYRSLYLEESVNKNADA